MVSSQNNSLSSPASINIQKIPKISVVTVTYNSVEVVLDTLASVINQTYPNVEYIVIDGSSSDGTQEVVCTYLNKLAYYVSESDNGPYDAMNKGIDVATGDWIIFINSGDYFVDDNIISKVFDRAIGQNIDFVYGDYIWKGVKHEKRIASRPLNGMWQRISFSHQSLFSRTKLMKEKKFDLRYKIASDYNFYFSCYMEGCRFLKVDMPISIFRAGGLSDINFFRRTYERWRVVTRYQNKLKVHLYYLYFLLSHYTKKIVLNR